MKPTEPLHQNKAYRSPITSITKFQEPILAAISEGEKREDMESSQAVNHQPADYSNFDFDNSRQPTPELLPTTTA